MRARQYNPQFGQFNTRDPLGQNGSAMWGGGYGNLYNYVNGQVEFGTDPSGLCLWQKNVSCLDLAQDVGKDVGYSTVMTFAAVGRGATGGLTDLAADSISEGASCTVDHTTGQAKTGEFLGTAAAVLTSGWSGFRGAKNITALRTRTTQTQHAAAETASAGVEGDAAEQFVFRVHGGDSGPMGHSWTPENPMEMANPRNEFGLPKGNSGQFLTKARVQNMDGVTQRPALPLDGNEGGAPEWLFPDPHGQLEPLWRTPIHPPF
jgi:hypothetical protein